MSTTVGIVYQFVFLQFAVLISIDWRLASGKLIHLKTISYDNDDVAGML